MENTGYSSVNMALDILQFAQGMQGSKTENQSVEDSDFQKLLDGKTESKPREPKKTAAKDSKPAEKTDTAEKKAPETEEKTEDSDFDVARQVVSMQMVQIEVPVQDVPVQTEEAAGMEVPVLPVQAETAGEVMQEVPHAPAEVKAGTDVKAEFEIPQQKTDTVEISETGEDIPVKENAGEAPIENDEPKAKIELKPEEEIRVSVKKEDNEDAGAAEIHLFKDVDAAPIKVAEPEMETAPDTENVAGQVKAGLDKALNEGESKVQIQLKPENLGVVNIEITHGRDGALSVVLSAVSEETHAMLTKHTSRLQSMLMAGAHQNVQVQVQRSDDVNHAENHQGGTQHQNQDNMYDGKNGHSGGQEQGREHEGRRHNANSGEDFLQQLRLGLIPTDQVS